MGKVDSAHSAISYAIKKAGELRVPSQLTPIFRLARRAKPYNVFSFTYSNFLDFKQFSEHLRLRSIRIDDEGNQFKSSFKTSHLDKNFKAMSLKRQVGPLQKISLKQLNKETRPITLEKYNNLMALCAGANPVISLPEHVQFYKNLPHTTTSK